MAESDRISAAARTNNRIRSEEVTTAERLVHPNVVSRRPRTVLQTSWDLRVRSCGRMAPSLSSGKWSNPRYGRSLRLLQGQLELLRNVCPPVDFKPLYSTRPRTTPGRGGPALTAAHGVRVVAVVSRTIAQPR